jgi:Transposase DDE domain
LSTLSTTELIKVRDALARALSGDDVNQLGRDTGQAKRLRTVTPHRLFLAVVSALASAHVESLADLLRAFNYQNGVTVAYKAFYNRLARIGFATFMREMFARLVERLSEQILTPEGHVAVARFKDIVIQDGLSFALKQTLRGTFPGRFTTIEPAAVEVHATYSGFADEVSAVQIAPDAEAERQFLPDPSTLKDRLLLADRGYPSVPYFEAVREQGGSFIVRLTRSYDPWVRTAWVNGRRVDLAPRRRLSRFLTQYPGRRLDLDVEYERDHRVVGFRVVVIPGRDKAMTRLCTNLPRTPFSLDLVARLYRFRWQIELCFKEWKSYANLHQFDTANAHIAEGLIWAGLCAAVLKRFLAHAAQRVGKGTAMSTRRVAMCAHHILHDVITALLDGFGLLGPLRRGLTYLLENARRANVQRDRRTGRLRAGLSIVPAVK